MFRKVVKTYFYELVALDQTHGRKEARCKTNIIGKKQPMNQAQTRTYVEHNMYLGKRSK